MVSIASSSDSPSHRELKTHFYFNLTHQVGLKREKLKQALESSQIVGWVHVSLEPFLRLFLGDGLRLLIIEEIAGHQLVDEPMGLNGPEDLLQANKSQ
jgi:hypothetical protein